MRRCVFALLAACGNPASHDDAGGDAIDAPGGPQVSGQLIELVADNDANVQLETRVLSLLPPRVALSARLDDGSLVQPTVTEGLFAFPLAHAGQRYQVTATFDDKPPEIIDSTSPTLVLGTASIGRTDRVPVTSPTTVTVTIPNFSTLTNDFMELDSTGVFMQAAMTAVPAAVPPTFVIDTAAAGNWFDGKPSLFSAAEHDQAMLVEWRPQSATLSTVVARLPLALTTSDGMASSFTQNVTSAQLACVGVDMARDQEMSRYLQALPGTYTGFTDVALIESPMGPGFGPGGARDLAQDLQSSPTGSIATHLTASITFLDAFDASHVLVQMAIGVGQTLGGVAAGGGTRTFVDVPLGPGCVAASVPAASVAIPTVATVAGMPITSDTTLHLDPTAAVPIAWDKAADGPADEYVVQLFEVTSTIEVLAQVVTTASETTIDRSFLVDGHTYAINVIAQAGLPNIAAGDFVTTAFPFASANALSHKFTVQP